MIRDTVEDVTGFGAGSRRAEAVGQLGDMRLDPRRVRGFLLRRQLVLHCAIASACGLTRCCAMGDITQMSWTAEMAINLLEDGKVMRQGLQVPCLYSVG